MIRLTSGFRRPALYARLCCRVSCSHVGARTRVRKEIFSDDMAIGHLPHSLTTERGYRGEAAGEPEAALHDDCGERLICTRERTRYRGRRRPGYWPQTGRTVTTLIERG